jgi:hypothetical protein
MKTTGQQKIWMAQIEGIRREIAEERQGQNRMVVVKALSKSLDELSSKLGE